jgi:hypothetical protein
MSFCKPSNAKPFLVSLFMLSHSVERKSGWSRLQKGIDEIDATLISKQLSGSIDAVLNGT